MNTAVNTVAGMNTAELNYGIVIANNGGEFPISKIVIRNSKYGVVTELYSPMLFSPILLGAELVKWVSKEDEKKGLTEHKVVAKASTDQMIPIMEAATEDRIKYVRSEGWSFRAMYYTYNAWKQTGQLDDIIKYVKKIAATNADEEANTEDSTPVVVASSDADPWNQLLNNLEEGLGDRQGSETIICPEGTTVRLYAYNRKGSYKVDVSDADFGFVCGFTSVESEYPLYDKYRSDSKKAEDAARFDKVIARAHKLAEIAAEAVEAE